MVEDLGYSTLYLADHFLGPGPALQRSGLPPQHLAAVPAMAAAAMVSSRLRIGCRVFCIDYHLTPVLAHELASLEALSDGRLEIGLGAGWLADEYAAAGIPFRPAGERVTRLESVVHEMKSYFGARNSESHPPILIGGAGPRMLSLAAREADVVSINSPSSSGRLDEQGALSSASAHTDRQVGLVRAAAGTRQPELELGVNFTVVDDNPAVARARLSDRLGVSEDVLADHPRVLAGNVDSICDQLIARRERYGVSVFTVFAHVARRFAPVVARLHGT